MKKDKTAQQNISLVIDTQHVDGEAAEHIQRIWEIHRPERQQADEERRRSEQCEHHRAPGRELLREQE